MKQLMEIIFYFQTNPGLASFLKNNLSKKQNVHKSLTLFSISIEVNIEYIIINKKVIEIYTN